jgi:hypothetical protein
MNRRSQPLKSGAEKNGMTQRFEGPQLILLVKEEAFHALPFNRDPRMAEIKPGTEVYL